MGPTLDNLPLVEATLLGTPSLIRRVPNLPLEGLIVVLRLVLTLPSIIIRLRAIRGKTRLRLLVQDLLRRNYLL